MATVTNKQLLRMIRKAGDMKQFEPAIKKEVLKSSRRLVESTPKDTGILSKPWTRIKKVGVVRWIIENNITTQGPKKWNIASLINDGTRNARKQKGFFYIPLSRRGKNKKLGAKIPKAFKFGVDYVLAKSRRGIKATHFIDKEEKKASKELEKAMLKELKRIFK